MSEQWLPVPGWETIYEVSDQGRVRNAVTGRVRTVKPHPTLGYRFLTLKAKGRKQKTTTVHSLVAEAFIGPRPLDADVMHLDGSRTNDCLTNLQYGTRTENNEHKLEHGTHMWGEKHYGAKLCEADVRRIRNSPETQVNDFAKLFGVDPETVRDARSGRTWANLR